jgi:hypothetical protein
LLPAAKFPPRHELRREARFLALCRKRPASSTRGIQPGFEAGGNIFAEKETFHRPALSNLSSGLN